MKTLGRGSLASFLRVALRIVLILLLIAIPFAAVGCVIAILRSYGVDIAWIDMPAPPSPILAWLFTLMVSVSLVCAIIIVSRLRAIFATLAAGDPFVPENASHMRVIAFALAAGELARYAISGAIIGTMIALKIEPPGDFEGEWIDLPLYVWFAVLTLIVLSEVFREGARMRQEQQFTI